jgi:hypothetical protein
MLSAVGMAVIVGFFIRAFEKVVVACSLGYDSSATSCILSPEEQSVFRKKYMYTLKTAVSALKRNKDLMAQRCLVLSGWRNTVYGCEYRQRSSEYKCNDVTESKRYGELFKWLLVLLLAVMPAFSTDSNTVPEALSHHWKNDCRLLETNIDKGFSLRAKSTSVW